MDKEPYSEMPHRGGEALKQLFPIGALALVIAGLLKLVQLNVYAVSIIGVAATVLGVVGRRRFPVHKKAMDTIFGVGVAVILGCALVRLSPPDLRTLIDETPKSNAIPVAAPLEPAANTPIEAPKPAPELPVRQPELSIGENTSPKVRDAATVEQAATTDIHSDGAPATESAATPTAVPAPATVAPSMLAIVRGYESPNPHPLEVALSEELRDLRQPGGASLPPVEVKVDIVNQRTPPTGTARFTARIQLSRAGSNACSFVVNHQEQRFSPMSPVFEPARLADVLKAIRTETIAYSNGNRVQCLE